LLQEFDHAIIDKKGTENVDAYHLSRIVTEREREGLKSTTTTPTRL